MFSFSFSYGEDRVTSQGSGHSSAHGTSGCDQNDCSAGTRGCSGEGTRASWQATSSIQATTPWEMILESAQQSVSSLLFSTKVPLFGV
eukprot:m.440918 g.440918  ORF g.440918 m.440918 type:complete len:88 (-) comp56795_c0_seq72:3008-3271(-)